jgi:hypothetical protein
MHGGNEVSWNRSANNAGKTNVLASLAEPMGSL